MQTLTRHIAAALAGGWFLSQFWPIDFVAAAAGAWFFYLLFEKPNDRTIDNRLWSPRVIDERWRFQRDSGVRRRTEDR